MYIADLHIHSRYSRATSRDLTPETLDFQARRKGIRLLGTGDFTHPAWREELKERLRPAEEGLYRLKEEYMLNPEQGAEGEETRFVISGEISSIYKQDGKVRKVHSLILLPGLLEAEKLSARLEAIGNIHSDGRPILGLSCRDLLEIMLEVCPEGMFIPAHIWTPHFSMFGAFSGFDRVEECFGDLTPYIHAVETGLSSDPPMNWRLSALDRFQLVSNSDAHSPAKLGREANVLGTELSYQGLKTAVETGRGLERTIEFFPEEGKYHFDGHRKCHICLSPAEAERYGGKCPVCGKKITIGVSHRVDQLADRDEGYVPACAKPFESLVPLAEVISASTGQSAAGKKVLGEYERMVRGLGTEFAILRELPLEDIRHFSGHRIAEGIRRLREGRVSRLPGFDGEYGTIRLFSADELDSPDGQMSMFGMMGLPEKEELPEGQPKTSLLPGGPGGEMPEKGEEQKTLGQDAGAPPRGAEHTFEADGQPDFLARLNREQRRAAQLPARSLAVIAGPGTGKTGTLAARIRCLLEERRVKPSEITAVTFTNRAAGELRERLRREMPSRRTGSLIQAGTFHSICYSLLKEAGVEFSLADGLELRDLAADVIKERGMKIRTPEFLRLVSETKNAGAPEKGQDFYEAYRIYDARLRQRGLFDFDDLLSETLRLLLEEDKKAKGFCSRFKYLLIDEFQDINPIQYRLIREWNRDGAELFVIGDPDQSIYGFRGSDAECFQRLIQERPETEVVRLVENYRSCTQVTDAACALISHNPGGERHLHAVSGAGTPVKIASAAGKRSEGIYAAREINRMIGGIDMLDAQEREPAERAKVRSFSDIAVLCRTHRQAEEIEECLKKEGIPYIVTGRGEFMEEETVREAVGFFRSLGEGEEKSELPFLTKRLGEDIYSALRDKYLPRMKKKPADLIKGWMEERGLSEDEPLLKLASMAVFHKTMGEFLDNLTFGAEGDLKRCGGKRYTSDAVSLMTLHAAKGLEFPAVIIAGVRRYSIPLDLGGKEGAALEEETLQEERRLFYVGMTRAKEELVLVTSGVPSEFLREIPERYTVHEEAARPREEARQMSLFDFIS